MVKDYAKYAQDAQKKPKGGIPMHLVWSLVAVVALVCAFVQPWADDDKPTAGTADLAPVPAQLAVSNIDTVKNQPTFDFYDILTQDSNAAMSMPIAQGAGPQLSEPLAIATKTAEPAPVKPKQVVSKVSRNQQAAQVKSKPKAKLKPIAKHKAPAKPAAHASAEPAKRYMVSVGEYKTYQEAQKHRASLILTGLDVKLAKMTLGDKSVYRLEMGPYVNWRHAHAAQLTLEQQHQLRGKIVQ